MKINDGGPAFPVWDGDHRGTQQLGMSLRAYLAGQALAGYLAMNPNPDYEGEHSEIWPLRQAALIIGVYTGIVCGPFGDVHELAEKLTGGPIWTHQFASKELAERLKELVKPAFVEICFEEEKS